MTWFRSRWLWGLLALAKARDRSGKSKLIVTLLGGTAASCPLVARAQQGKLPIIGFLGADASSFSPWTAAFVAHLRELGWIEGRTIAIEYRWSEGRPERYAEIAAEFVRLKVDVIVTVGSAEEVLPKRLELLHELLPTARVMALLVNPANPALAEPQAHVALSAAKAFGLEFHVLNASTEGDFGAVFAKLIELRADGLVIGGDALFSDQIDQLAALTVHHAMPAIYQRREFAAAGGLVSYGGDITFSYRLAGVYVARILKGEKPANLPVQQATKVELYINLKTAKALGLTIPLSLLGRADEVFE